MVGRRAASARRQHHIQRHERRGFKGWMVYITRARRVVCHRYFADRSFGGRAQALRAAIAHRDRLLRRLPPPVLAKLQHSRNTTGVVGVHRFSRQGRHGLLWYYVANWVWPPRSRNQVRKTFSARRFGMRGARQKAIDARRAALARTAAEERQRVLRGIRLWAR
jgi:hypothetical protein